MELGLQLNSRLPMVCPQITVYSYVETHVYLMLLDLQIIDQYAGNARMHVGS